MNAIFKILALGGLVGVLAAPVKAIPTVQVYIDSATAGDIGGDQDTWFSIGNSFDLRVVGAWKAAKGNNPATTSLTSGTLVFSVPQGQTGTITISPSFGNQANLLTMASLTGNPLNAADTDILTDIDGDDGYNFKGDFLPVDANFNNHFPFQDGVSDFVLFDLANFANMESPLHDYNAGDGGSTDVAAGSSGEEKVYQVSFTGFTQLHIDAYMLENNTNLVTSWDINPGSHDATAFSEGFEPIPAPGAFVLGLMGMGMVSAVRRRLS